MTGFIVLVSQSQVPERHVKRKSVAQADEILVPRHVCFAGTELFQQALGCDGGQVFINCLQRAMTGEEFGGGLGADARDNWNAIHCIAHKAQPVDDLGGEHAAFGANFVIAPESGVLVVGIEERNTGADELHKVLVGTSNYDWEAHGFGPTGEGGDGIV